MTSHLARRFLFFSLAVLLVTGCATTPPATTTPATSAATEPAAPAAAAGAATVSYRGTLPPLIDRELFFGDPEIASAQLSPDGRWISFRKPHMGVMNIWVKGVNDPWTAARPVTADTKRSVGGYFWSEDGKYILYVQDKGGNENYHIYSVDPAAPADAATSVPPARDLTPMESVRAAIYAVPESRPNEIIVGLNDRNPALHDVYRLNIATGEKTLILKNEQNVAGWITDRDGNIRGAYRQTPDGGSEILTVSDGKLGQAIYTCSYLESCSPTRFNREGSRLYITSNKGDDVDRTRLMLLDPATGKTEVIESDPNNEVDFGGALFSDKTEELVGTVYNGDMLRVYMRDPVWKADYDFVRSKLPDGEIRIVSTTNDDDLMLVNVSSDVNAGTVYLYDRKNRTLTRQYDLRPNLSSNDLAPMKAVRYRARDGRMIPAYLTLPKGVEGKDLPTVIFPHGGPWARDFWGYSSWPQFLANRGYAVLRPNFRGSSGYGKEFLNAGNFEWGIGAMQHDITDGVKYLIDQGIADPKRIAIMGGSYGGYATLAGITFTPDLYAAAVDIVGPSNITTLIRSFPPYWRPMLKGSWFMRVGDPDVEKDAARLREQSPLFFAERIKTPLLLVHGANDPRVKKEESDQIIVALRELGRDVEYIVAPDEGHGFVNQLNNLALAAAVEKFYAKYLGGRYQVDVRPEIQQKLAAITVDVSKVQRPQLTDKGAFVAPKQ
ncbi:MAG TPA: S9 family peptidase [Thermoanaerobaculia bacterium]|nr:S9 family peptidase [Thermoanaerobaculia bacterium]